MVEIESQSEQSGSSARLRKRKQMATAAGPKRAKLKSGKLTETGRAMFQMTKSSKLREAFYCALCVYLVYVLRVIVMIYYAILDMLFL